MKQEYYCEECEVLASCTIPRDSDVQSALQIIGEAHAKKSPACAFLNQVRSVRVRAPDCSPAEWREVIQNGRDKVSEREKEVRLSIAELLDGMNHLERRRILMIVADHFGYKLTVHG